MDEWTRDELVALYPDGTVNVQVDDNVRPMTTDEWSAWIDGQAGQKKPEKPLDFEEFFEGFI